MEESKVEIIMVNLNDLKLKKSDKRSSISLVLNWRHRSKCHSSQLIRHLHQLLIESRIMFTQVWNVICLLLQQFCHICSSLHETNRANCWTNSMLCVRRKLRCVELQHLANICYVHKQEDDRLYHLERRDVHNWTVISFQTSLSKIRPVEMLQACSNAQNHSIPQIHDCHWNRFVCLSRTTKLMISVQFQLVVMILDDCVENLQIKIRKSNYHYVQKIFCEWVINECWVRDLTQVIIQNPTRQ